MNPPEKPRLLAFYPSTLTYAVVQTCENEEALRLLCAQIADLQDIAEPKKGRATPWMVTAVDPGLYRKLRPGDEPPEVEEHFVSAKAAGARIGLGPRALKQAQRYQEMARLSGKPAPPPGFVVLRGVTFCDLAYAD